MSSDKRCIRVAQILNRMDNGGIEAVVLNYYRHIDRKEFQFDFFFDEESFLPYREEMMELGAGLFPLPPYTHQADYQKKLEKALRAGRYDIAHVHMNTMSVFALTAAKRAGIPVRICHNHSTADRREGKRALLKILLRPWNRLPATHLFACGKQAGEWMYGRRAIEEGKVFILPNAIETERFAYDAEARKAVREELEISENAFVVGHIGRFMTQKNHEGLLKVFQSLYEERKDAILLLVGEGEREERIRELAREMRIENRVVFAGVRKDIQRVYSAMDVFCLPSLYEGFPVVLLEAQANGLPVVCSDNVSAEVCLTGLVRQLPLEKEALWTETMLKAKRKQVVLPEEYEIGKTAERLEKKYRQLVMSN